VLLTIGALYDERVLCATPLCFEIVAVGVEQNIIMQKSHRAEVECGVFAGVELAESERRWIDGPGVLLGGGELAQDQRSAEDGLERRGH